MSPSALAIFGAEAPGQQTKDRLGRAGGRDHDVRLYQCPVRQADASSASLGDENLFDRCVQSRDAPQLSIAVDERVAESRRAPFGPRQPAAGQIAEDHQQEQRRRFGWKEPPEDGMQARALQLAVDPGGERLAEMDECAEAVAQLPDAAQPLGQCRELRGPIDMRVEIGNRADCPEQACELVRILRSDPAERVMRALQVGGDRHFPLAASVPIGDERFQRAQSHVRHDTQLFVQLQEWAAGQPMDAPVHGIGPAVPGGADAAERQVVLEDRDVESVGARVTPGGQPRQSASDDRQLDVAHGNRSPQTTCQRVVMRTLPVRHSW